MGIVLEGGGRLREGRKGRFLISDPMIRLAGEKCGKPEYCAGISSRLRAA